MKKHLYMMTTQDKYELPLAVADSPRELAEMTGTAAQVITQAISHRKSVGKKSIEGKGKHPKWHKVAI